MPTRFGPRPTNVCARRHALRRDVRCLFDAPASAECPIPAESKLFCPEPKPLESAQTEETRFHQDLRTVVERNAGFFWVWGQFLWCEIMMLAVLGVVTRKLVVFAAAYASGRGHDGSTDLGSADPTHPLWQPRESVQTLMQLVAAPIFSLVIIWILKLTDLISVKPMIGDVWSNSIVPIAFLLGLFPSLGYEVLHGLARGAFGRRMVGDRAVDATPARIVEATPAPATPDSAATSFNDLRQRVRHHALTVLER